MNADFISLTVFCFIIITIATAVVRAKYRREFLVNEGFVGLLYRRGKLIAALAPGLYARWGTHFRLQCLDRRQVLLVVAGQEVLTADNVAVKLSVVLTTQLVDAAKAVLTADNPMGHIYSATQTAIRTVVAGVTLEALLGQRVAFAAQLRELVAPAAATLGVQIHAAEVRDVMLPGDLRKAFSETLKARQEGQAALERARGESAALRSLANAARLLEGHPALATLRFLQTLEGSGSRQTLVMNDLAPLLATLKTRGGSDSAPSSAEN